MAFPQGSNRKGWDCCALPWCDRNQIAKAGIACLRHAARTSFLLAMTDYVIANAALAECSPLAFPQGSNRKG
ncbi:MAG: hypothetical protein V7L25_00250 [Nostoc sp.]|uniref:hypothetical protein n=1 Tax=Nostoc sp. TaxID=1180 RepID=UPI002FF2CC9E